jgi:hypothetical protein
MEKSYHFFDVRQDNEIVDFPDQADHLQRRGESRDPPDEFRRALHLAGHAGFRPLNAAPGPFRGQLPSPVSWVRRCWAKIAARNSCSANRGDGRK